MRNNLTLLLTGLLFFACNLEKESVGSLYLSNISQDYFDSAAFNVFIDDTLMLADTVRNKYVSFHWEEKRISIPKRKFKLRVSIIGKGFAVTRDTVIESMDSLKMFVRFNFYPHYKRYHNPEIFRRLHGETTRLKFIADSLYENNLLPNASEYLNDTIPLRKNIEIVIK